MSIPITLVNGALAANLISLPIGPVGGALLNITNETIAYLVTPLFKQPSIATSCLTLSATYTLMNGLGFTLPIRDFILFTITTTSLSAGLEFLMDNATAAKQSLQAVTEVMHAREIVTQEL